MQSGKKSEKKLKELIGELTLEEKASLCSGLDFWQTQPVERLGIASIMVADGPHGLRKQVAEGDHLGLNHSVPATCYPTASALASAWDPELLRELGAALGREALAQGVSVLLGPGVNIKRSPLCGRNFEYLSEDPYLTGELACAFIEGVQSRGVGTSLKHFAVNNQEYRRMAIDAAVDERTLREIYLPGFERAVRGAQPWTVMCSYNKINGVYASENEYLLNDILKKEWGHTGLVITDWGAVNIREAGIQAGCELEMPGNKGQNDKRLVQAVRQGRLEEDALDLAVKRILELVEKGERNRKPEARFDPEEGRQLARRIAGRCAILLKNEGGLLPLSLRGSGRRIAVIGEFAKSPRYQGGGSSQVNPTRLDNTWDELEKILSSEQDANPGSDDRVELVYARGYTRKSEAPDKKLIKEACKIARDADIAIVFAGLPETYEIEALDREHMNLPASHNRLIEAVAEANPNLVVVLSNGSAVSMPWADRVPAILEAYLGGQAGGGALADIISGRVNPSGKLAESFPVALSDNSSYHYFPGGPRTVEYRESVFVGYRHYDTAGILPLFPFGHGLSYTRFEYSDLTFSSKSFQAGETLNVRFKLKNTGPVAGREIAQLYIKSPAKEIFRPWQELKAFKTAELKPDEETEITLELDARSFSYYDVQTKSWRMESGQHQIRVAASSRDIRLYDSLTIQTGDDENPHTPDESLDVYRKPPRNFQVDREVFEKLYAGPLPNNRSYQSEPFGMNTPLEEMRNSLTGSIVFGVLRFKALRTKELQDAEDSDVMRMMLERGLEEATLRSAINLARGQLTEKLARVIRYIVDGKILQGIKHLIRG